MKVWVGPSSKRPKATGAPVASSTVSIRRAGGDLVLTEGHEPADLELQATDEAAEAAAAEVDRIVVRSRWCRLRVHHVDEPEPMPRYGCTADLIGNAISMAEYLRMSLKVTVWSCR